MYQAPSAINPTFTLWAQPNWNRICITFHHFANFRFSINLPQKVFVHSQFCICQLQYSWLDCCQSFCDCFSPHFLRPRYRPRPDRMHVWVCKNVCPFLPRNSRATQLNRTPIIFTCIRFRFMLHVVSSSPRQYGLRECQHSWTPGLLHGNVSLKFEFILRITNSQHVCHSTCHSLVVAATFSVAFVVFRLLGHSSLPGFLFFFFCVLFPAIFNCMALLLVFLVIHYILYMYISFRSIPADWCLCARQCPLFDFSFISKICNAPHVATEPVPLSDCRRIMKLCAFAISFVLHTHLPPTVSQSSSSPHGRPKYILALNNPTCGKSPQWHYPLYVVFQFFLFGHVVIIMGSRKFRGRA